MIEWLLSLDIATVMMIVVMFLGAWILWTVQQDKHNDFDFQDMLRDENGKPSAFRLAVFISLAVSTWVIMRIVLKTNAIDSWIFVTYLGIWSGAKVAETALNAYSGRTRRYSEQEDSMSYRRTRRFDPPETEDNRN